MRGVASVSLAAVILYALVGAHPTLASERTFSLESMARISDVRDSAITLDGSHIAFVVERADLELNRYRDQLWSYDVARGRARLLSATHSSYRSPAWSADGRSLAVISDDGATDADQIFEVNPLRGTLRRLTAGSSDVLNFAWRPDGAALAFTRRDVPAKKHGAAAFEDAVAITDNAYLTTGAAMPVHLWLSDRNGVAARLTGGPESVVDSTLSWSPDGMSLLYLRAPNGIHAWQGRAAAYVLDVRSRASRALTPHAAYEDQALWSPDGSDVLYLYARDGDPMSAADAMFIGADGAHDRDLSRDLDRHVETAAWMPHGSVLLKVYDGTSGPLFVLPVAGPARRLPLGPVVNATIDPAQSVARDGSIAFVGAEAGRPSELYFLAPGAPNPQRLTDFNHDVAALTLGRAETISWRNGGFAEVGVLTYPPDFDRVRKGDPGHRFPLVLRIHGGPAETSMTAFDSFYQLAAARGYLVFAPNYRGSTNLGDAFMHAIYNDASAGPGTDIMAGVEAVEGLGIVDSGRLAVSGWSYGGQLTSWMIGHYPIWRCAVTGAAVNDLIVDYAIADDIHDDRVSFTDSPFVGDELAIWREQSPITYFKSIRTPLLLLGNVYDVRVPIVEQFEMYHALRDNNVPTEFYVYPSGGHLPSGPVRLADAYRRWLSWFARYLR